MAGVKGRSGRKKKVTPVAGTPGIPSGLAPLPAKPAACPAPPAYLSKAAKVWWRDIAPLAYELDRLTPLDVPAFATLCDLCAQEVRLQRELARVRSATRTAQGTLVQHPVVSALNAVRTMKLRHLDMFGMTPTSRTRIPASAAPAPVVGRRDEKSEQTSGNAGENVVAFNRRGEPV